MQDFRRRKQTIRKVAPHGGGGRGGEQDLRDIIALLACRTAEEGKREASGEEAPLR